MLTLAAFGLLLSQASVASADPTLSVSWRSDRANHWSTLTTYASPFTVDATHCSVVGLSTDGDCSLSLTFPAGRPASPGTVSGTGRLEAPGKVFAFSFTYIYRASSNGDNSGDIVGSGPGENGTTVRLLGKLSNDQDDVYVPVRGSLQVAPAGELDTTPRKPENIIPPSLVDYGMGSADSIEVDPGRWSANPRVQDYMIRWERCDAGGGNCGYFDDYPVKLHTRYNSLSPADIGFTFRASVRADNGVAVSDTLVTPASSQVQPDYNHVASAPTWRTPPLVAGEPAVGATLRTTDGYWWPEGRGGMTFERSWYRCNGPRPSAGLIRVSFDWGDCVRISGATSSSYVVTTADANKYILSEITVTSPIGSTSKKSDYAIGPIK